MLSNQMNKGVKGPPGSRKNKAEEIIQKMNRQTDSNELERVEVEFDNPFAAPDYFSAVCESTGRIRVKILQLPWVLLVFEILEVIQIMFSIGYTVADYVVDENQYNEKLMLLYILVRVGLLTPVAVGFAAFTVLFAYEESIFSCARAWIYGGFFFMFQRAAMMAFVGVLLRNCSDSDLSEIFVLVIVLDCAVLFIRLLTSCVAYTIIK